MPKLRQHLPSVAVIAVIMLATFVAFFPALKAGFVTWDDQANFLANPDYRGFSGPHLKWMWTTILLGHYVPLSWMSLALDYELWGMNPAGYHLSNVLLHAASTVLLYFVAMKLLVRVGVDRATATLPALFAALFFGLHPLRVESVAWITERRDVLSLLFSMSSTLAYLRATQADRVDRRWYAVSLTAFVCALLSKATAVTLPIGLLLLNVYPLRRISSRTGKVVAELLPFVLLSLAASAVSIVALQPGAQLPWPAKLAVSCYSLALYIGKTLIPTGLSPLYEMPTSVHPGAPAFLAAYVAIAALFLAVLVRRAQWPALTIAWAAFVAMLLPLLGVVQNGPQIAADRYTYHAAPALSLVAAAALLSLPRRLHAPVAASVLLLLGALTWRQTGVWTNSETLWRHVVESDSASALGNNNLGVVLAESGRTAEAIDHYHRSIKSRPGYADPRNNLGYELTMLGRLEEAIAQLDTAVVLKPDYVEAYINLGNALLAEGRLRDAIAHYETAASIHYDNAGLHYDWGIALMRDGKLEDAIGHFGLAVELDPSFDDARRALSQAQRSLTTVR